MTERIPQNFLKSPEGTLVSYDGADFASGVAYKNFYGAMYASGALVTGTALYSDKIDTAANVNGTGHIGSLIFTSTTFAKPMIIKGDGYINIPMHSSAAGGESSTTFCSGALILVSASAAETTLASFTTGNLVAPDPSNITNHKGAVLTIARRKIKKGEKLKLKISHECSAVTGTVTASIVHDPAGRGPTADNTTGGATITYDSGDLSQLILSLPFEADL